MVNHAHNLPDSSAPECMLCRDTGLTYHDNTYRVCMAPHTEGKRHQLMKEAAEANETLRKLERKYPAK